MAEKEKATIGEYKGHPIISIPDGSKHGFTFGLRKARLVLEYLSDIELFVQEQEAKDEEES